MEVNKTEFDKHNLMKQELFEEFQLKYSQIVRYVKTMPLDVNMKMNGFARADEFYFWIREAISHIQFMQEPQQAPTPEEPSTPEPEKVAESAPLE